MQPKQWLNHAKERGFCLNCLQLFVKAHTCSRKVCHKCHKRHHTLLHIDKQKETTNDNGSTINNNQFANTKSSINAEANTYYTLKGKSRNLILLATTNVDVKNKFGQYVPCKAFLDSGS
jgi:hypothetical protein